MKRFTLAALVAAVAITSAPVWAQDAAPTQPEKQSDQSSRIIGKPTITLVDAGKGDKIALRYHPKPGDSFILSMGMSMSASMTMNGTAMPANEMPKMTFDMQVTADQIDDAGIHFAALVKDLQIADSPMTPMIKPMLEPMKGVKMNGLMTDRGEVKSVKIDTPADMPPEVVSQLSSLRDSLDNMATFLPEEPVGADARWTAEYTFSNEGIVIKQNIEYTVASIEGSVVKLSAKVTQTAEKQELKNDQLPAGMTMELTSLKGTGEGTSTIDLSWLVPSQSTADSTINMQIAAGQMGDFTQKVKTSMTMNGKRAE